MSNVGLANTKVMRPKWGKCQFCGRYGHKSHLCRKKKTNEDIEVTALQINQPPPAQEGRQVTAKADVDKVQLFCEECEFHTLLSKKSKATQQLGNQRNKRFEVKKLIRKVLPEEA